MQLHELPLLLLHTYSNNNKSGGLLYVRVWEYTTVLSNIRFTYRSSISVFWAAP